MIPLEQKEKEFYTKEYYDVQFQGEYASMLDFLHDFNECLWPQKIISIELCKDEKNDVQLLMRSCFYTDMCIS